MIRCPSTYAEWRSIYQSCMFNLGYCADLYFRHKASGEHDQAAGWMPLIWRNRQRLKRIHDRMNACQGDETWCQGILDMVFERQKEKGHE